MGGQIYSCMEAKCNLSWEEFFTLLVINSGLEQRTLKLGEYLDFGKYFSHSIYSQKTMSLVGKPDYSVLQVSYFSPFFRSVLFISWKSNFWRVLSEKAAFNNPGVWSSSTSHIGSSTPWRDLWVYIINDTHCSENTSFPSLWWA